MSQELLYEVEDGVGRITFNRPEARNALTWEMYDALVEACDEAESHPDLRVFIIRGAGGAFSAGTDIAQFKDFDGADGVAYEKRLDGVPRSDAGSRSQPHGTTSKGMVSLSTSARSSAIARIFQK